MKTKEQTPEPEPETTEQIEWLLTEQAGMELLNLLARRSEFLKSGRMDMVFGNGAVKPVDVEYFRALHEMLPRLLWKCGLMP